MAWTQSQLDELDDVIAGLKGIRETSFGEQSARFGSPKELLELRATMEAEINKSTRRGFRVAAVDKGV